MSKPQKKRTTDPSNQSGGKKKNVNFKEEEPIEESEMIGDNIEGLEFEDPFGDEFEEEIIEQNDEDEEDEDEEGEGVDGGVQAEEEEAHAPKQVWRPGIDKLPEGEELEYDPSAYIMYHSLRTEWPCLSFDIIRDTLGDNRQRFPLSMYLVTGSQADSAEKNKLTLLQLTDLHKTYVGGDSDEESEDDENLDEDPTIEHLNVNHQGGVNRVRNMPQHAGMVATMADTGKVHIFDLHASVTSMFQKLPRVAPPTKPVFTFSGHREEGFAIDWSPATAGRLATGDCAGNVHVWNPSAGGTHWQVDNAPYRGHEGSVEDIQWSPTEGTVFATCSSDKTVRIWDIRDKAKPQITWQAHSEDVNVISWNRSVGFLLASGSDDSSFKVWDLRTVKNKGCTHLVHFTYHKAPITSLEWAPHDESMITVSSDDNQISVWDLSVEADDEAIHSAAMKDPTLQEFPPQLLFLHMGQNEIKEVHYHPQIPGCIVSTASDSFNVFKPAITVAT